jgi:hypothetical protein
MEVKVMNWTMSLFALCSLAGLLMVAGSLLLLWKGRIYLDKEGQSVSKVELPLGIKFESQFPVLVMFLFGVFMLFIPIHYCPQLCGNPAAHLKQPLEMVELRGKVNSGKPVQVNVIAAERMTDTKQGVDVSVPYFQNGHYVVKYYNARGEYAYSENVDLRAGETKRELIGYDEADTLHDAQQLYGAPRDFERRTLSGDLVAQFKSQ